MNEYTFTADERRVILRWLQMQLDGIDAVPSAATIPTGVWLGIEKQRLLEKLDGGHETD